MINVLIGATCSGKTTAFKHLSQLGYNPIVSYTTRPKRENEIHGKDYFFISDEEYNALDKENKLIAKNSFESAYSTIWSYGINASDINLKENLIVITEPHGYRELVERFGKGNVTGIYLKTKYHVRLVRGLDRKDKVEELIRRLDSDEIDFSDIDSEVDYVIEELEINTIIEKITSIIMKEAKAA